jgi:hypothetical protein
MTKLSFQAAARWQATSFPAIPSATWVNACGKYRSPACIGIAVESGEAACINCWISMIGDRLMLSPCFSLGIDPGDRSEQENQGDAHDPTSGKILSNRGACQQNSQYQK